MGVLGTAQIAPVALLRPARSVPEVEVIAVASRDEQRARRFADRHHIPRVHRTYAELITDPHLDAVYVPLPNSLHAAWTIRALDAGKHVLCEKPLAANAREAALTLEAAVRAGRVLAEGLHWRHHPLADRMRQLIESGGIGAVRRIEVTLTTLRFHPGDIRFRADLGGGALMDLGCYAIDILRHLAGAEPDVVAAVARLGSSHVDRWLRADLRFPDGRTGRLTCALFSASLFRREVRVVGDSGEMRVTNPLAPHLFHRLRILTQEGRQTERVPGESSYAHQLRAFAAAVLRSAPLKTDGTNGVANMQAIDAIYRAAGMRPRGL